MEKEKKVRIIVAGILIVIGIASLLLWELWGREYVTYESVLVAADDIKPGDKITERNIKEKKFRKDNIISNALTYDDVEKVRGMIAKQSLIEGSQLHISYLTNASEYIETGESIYKIPNEWIASCSSSVRRGDTIIIYTANDEDLGCYKVAFVKDAQEREITSIDTKEKEVLERTESTGVIDNIEIITTLENYKRLKTYASAEGTAEDTKAGKFTIVQIF